MTPPDTLAWGILSTGRIAHTFARALRRSRRGRLVAVGSRSAESAERFASEYGCRAHPSYESLLADREVDAVYIAPPHPVHARWAVLAARAKKHILCEKPLGLNASEGMAMIDAARQNDVFLLEAFMYRFSPQTKRLLELVKSGAVGRVKAIDASFGFDGDFSPESRLLAPELGGGALLDVGCYPVSMSRLIAGAAQGLPFVEPIDVQASGELGATRVDEHVAAVLKFPSGILATVRTSIQLLLPNEVRVLGSEGTLIVSSPWLPAENGGTTEIVVERRSGEREVHRVEAGNLYAYEIDAVAEQLAARQAQEMSHADTLGNLRVLDQIRRQIGVVYPSESLERPSATVTGEPLEKRAGAPMKYVELGLPVPVSRLGIGIGDPRGQASLGLLLDAFFERGGNLFESAYHYGRGHCERVLGHWLKSRGVRGQAIIVSKGGHTPFCTPKDLSWQLEHSLEMLGIECLDVYLMHRDNLDVPVGEFVDVLNLHARAGRIKQFGVSNWTVPRLRAANEYAKEHSLKPVQMLSNQLSLARMEKPPWEGCLSSWDPEYRAYLREQSLPHLAWSSGARGYFSEPVYQGNVADAVVLPTWQSEANAERRERARTLGAERGVSPVAVSVAYVLAQDFPSLGLIGPRSFEELNASLACLDLTLSPAELAWLDLRSDQR
ncbi:MAG TPA: aldo/keto reductase [Polyangiaceae bacterium]